MFDEEVAQEEDQRIVTASMTNTGPAGRKGTNFWTGAKFLRMDRAEASAAGAPEVATYVIAHAAGRSRQGVSLHEQGSLLL